MMGEFDMYGMDDNGNRAGRIGRVSMDGDGRLAVVQAEPAAAEALERALKDVNGREGLVLKDGSDQVGWSGRSLLTKERIARGDERFTLALQDNLQRWHAMELDLPKPAPGEEEDDEADDGPEDEDEA